jgi:hypothetical protein
LAPVRGERPVLRAQVQQVADVNKATGVCLGRRFPLDAVTGQTGSSPMKARPVLAWLEQAKSHFSGFLGETQADLGDVSQGLGPAVQSRVACKGRRCN